MLWAMFRPTPPNPLISQKELADKAGITRSSVAVHISNLMKKGYITGNQGLGGQVPVNLHVADGQGHVPPLVVDEEIGGGPPAGNDGPCISPT